MGPMDLYRYLTTARGRLFDQVRGLAPEQYTQVFPFGLGTIRRTLHHMAGAEWFLVGQLRGGPQGDYPFRSEQAPDFAALERGWRDLERQTLEFLNTPQDWTRMVEFTVTIPSRQRYRVKASAEVVFTHFTYHEVHHRAQVMAMLRQVGAPLETLDFLLTASGAVEEV